MADLVPIKVKIGLKIDGKHDYPNFNALSATGGMDWSKYVDRFGLGWHYDSCCGHDVEKPGSPRGIQYGVLIIPKSFADEAIAVFPGQVTKLTEIELEDFYDNHAHKQESEEHVNDEALKPFIVKDQLKIALTPAEEALKAKAIDPNDETAGITKNKRKHWSDWKTETGTTIVQ